MHAIDLTTLASVKSYLGIVNLVDTLISASTATGSHVVTPISMNNIVVGMQLTIDVGASQEFVIVVSTTSTTFTATFAVAHGTNCIVTASSDDLDISKCISSASLYWIWATGRDDQSGDTPAKSPLVEHVTYTEVYDGNGGDRMFLRVAPIASVTSLNIDGRSIPASASFSQFGYIIDQSRKSIAIRGSGFSGRGGYNSRFGLRVGSCQRFNMGIGNVEIVYVAGYNGVPFDIAEKCTLMVAVNYKRKNYVDQASTTFPSGEGIIKFREWELPPSVCSVMDNYSRQAIV